MVTTSNEKVKDLDKKIKQLQAQRHQLLAKVKDVERRKRTRRQIEIGATLDSIGIDTLAKVNAFKAGLKVNLEVKNWLTSLYISNFR